MAGLRLPVSLIGREMSGYIELCSPPAPPQPAQGTVTFCSASGLCAHSSTCRSQRVWGRNQTKKPSITALPHCSTSQGTMHRFFPFHMPAKLFLGLTTA